MIRGECPFCGDKVTFRQRAYGLAPSRIKGEMIPLQCEGCKSVMAYCLSEEKIYPHQELRGLTELPKDIQKYYDESLRCVSSDCPNGAATLFRKIIHSIGIHYGIAQKNDDKNLYEIINELHKQGHIVTKLKDALLGIKDIGNDGAHINDNEPDMAQAEKIRGLIETVLTATVICDKELDFIKDAHKPNIIKPG